MSQTLDLDGAPAERVVISGMSGSFPRSRHIRDLSNILYNKENPITENETRWKYEHPEVPQSVGLVPELEKFDAQFFKVSYRLGVNMDPMSRVILEQTYAAIYDAGVNPQQLSGKKIGVYVGSCLSETEKIGLYTYGKTGLGIVGCNKSMFANRISYWLNIKGPSQAIDGGCCSSIVALEQACQAMALGACEGAIVGGCNLCLHPQTSVHFGRNIKLSWDAKTKSYDKAADGCVRSEAVSVLFLQKAKDALRIYAEVVAVKSSYVSQASTGSFKRAPGEITQFLKKFYDGIKVSPREVTYVEGFGAADLETDKAELVAIDNVFSPGRTEPLYVGSVMSNVGYCESASGVVAITKVLLGFHNGLLPANLHCSEPRDDIEAVRAGRLRIMGDHTPAGTYVAVNGLSVTGVNSHVLLRGYYKRKDLQQYQSSIPRLVMISARTDSAVQNIFNDLKSRPIDVEELALIQNIHSAKINGHLGRGFVVLDTDKDSKTTSLCEKASYFDGGSRPLWFVYSGMGSQWAGMAAQLMKVPIFAAAIERCRRALEPKGIDLLHIITSPDKTIYDNILHSFVGIAACQIGLTDILLQLGLVPDKIIGHSVGELGCAYADGCLSAEEMILSAYSRGLVSIQTPFIHGSMAAVGVGYKQMSTRCPPEIEIACHNSADSCTISGPSEAMTQLVAQLTSEGIFAKEVPCSNIAYHSRYIAEAGPGLLKYLKQVIKTPKKRSDRWVSTSVPQERWGEEGAQYSSAEYHTNNLLNPVLFEETSQLIPSNAVLVEVAPHGLLQAILKRAMPSCTHVPLTRRGHPDNARLLLEAVGQLFMEGYYPDIRHLYPKVEFPVSTGTPHLSPLVEWVHHEKWQLAQYANALRVSTATCTFKITLHDDDYRFLHGHRVRGNVVFPFAAALVCAWDTLAMATGVPRRTASPRFDHVELHAQPILNETRLLRLNVALHRGTGWFEIDDGITRVASGYIKLITKLDLSELPVNNEDINKEIKLETEEIYQILNEKGFVYGGEFRGIREANASFTEGRVSWTRWEAFLDALLQFNALHCDALQRDAYMPAFIREIAINTDLHAKAVESKTDLKIEVSKIHDYTRCGGVTMKGMKFRHVDNWDKRPLVFDTPNVNPRNKSGKNVLNGTNGDTHLNGKAKENGSNGDFESALSRRFASEDSTMLVKVHYAGLSARDVVHEKKVHEDKTCESGYGMDFSGYTKNGMRVMGLAPGEASRPLVHARPELLWPVPPHWSLEDAVTVPFAYAHALYCLGIKTQLLPRKSVLVGHGAGATGQAVIALALHCDCRVFVVVGNPSKKRFLLKMFPKLLADDVICCRDDTFMCHVLTATNGRGCEYVICARGDHKDVYLNCAAAFGYTFDIHRVNMNENYSFKMGALSNERHYVSVDFLGLFEYNDMNTLKKLQHLLAEGISGGWVRPLSRVTFPVQESPRALQLLALGAHRGRVLLRIQAESALTMDPTIQCSGCHLIVSDDEGAALRLAERLVRRGARALHLHLARASPRLRLAMQSWTKSNVKIVTSSEDLANNECASNLLNQSLSLGPLEGIFVVLARPQTSRSKDIYHSLLTQLDTKTRQMCPHLKYFAVIGINTSVGEQLCQSRAAAGLPATTLSVSMNMKDGGGISETLAASYSNIVDAIEQSLLSREPAISAHYPPRCQHTFLQQFEKITGITISETDTDKQTLQDLGLSVDKVPALCAFLRNERNISVQENEVLLLSVGKLRAIEMALNESDFGSVKGLSVFFPFVDSDELYATISDVIMPTLTRSSDMRDDEFDASVACLYILPGLQGLHQRYSVMCERLQLSAVVLQPGLDLQETLQDTIQRYVKIFRKKKADTNKFYLLGHELGVVSALEMAAALEDLGMTGTVFCLGGGPDEFADELERELRVACAGDSDAKLQDSEQGAVQGTALQETVLQEAVAKHMCALMGVTSPQLDAALRDAPTWPLKVEASVRALRGHVTYSMQYARLLIEAAYARVSLTRQRAFPAPRKLRSRVVLMQSPGASVRASNYSLQRYSCEPIIVERLRAPLPHAADDLRAATIVNRYIDDEAKLYFANKALCHTYLLNRNVFFESN